MFKIICVKILILFSFVSYATSISFANDVLHCGPVAGLTRDTSNLGNGPVQYYEHNANGRTEVMEAHILPAHLDTGTATNDAARTYAHQMGRANDDAGHILAKRLGGSGLLHY